MTYAPRREKNRKAFTSPNGLALLAKFAPYQKSLKYAPSLALSTDKAPTTKVESNVIDRHKPSEDF